MNSLEDTDDGFILAPRVEDPAQHDTARDLVVVTTRRGLSRIAFVAAEAAVRFEREGIEHDPVAWMMAPRRLFEGAAAIDACLERQSFLRAIILHGLSWGMDAFPEQIDPLIDDDADDDFDHEERVCALPNSPRHRRRMAPNDPDDVGPSDPHNNAPEQCADRGNVRVVNQQVSQTHKARACVKARKARR